MKRYIAIYERGKDKMWTVSVPELDGCHTQGKTLATAKRRVIEAIEVTIGHDLPKDVIIEDEIKLRYADTDCVRRVRGSRRVVEVAMFDARIQLEEAIKRFHKKDFSLREIGQILGVSHQRVGQILNN